MPSPGLGLGGSSDLPARGRVWGRTVAGGAARLTGAPLLHPLGGQTKPRAHFGGDICKEKTVLGSREEGASVDVQSRPPSTPETCAPKPASHQIGKTENGKRAKPVV